MRKNYIIGLLVIFTLMGFKYETGVWERKMISVSGGTVTDFIFHPFNHNLGYLTSSKGLFEINIAQQTQKQLFSLPIHRNTIYQVLISSHNPDQIYLATDDGLYESDDAGQNFNRIYNSSDEQKGRCLSVFKMGESIYLGTGAGMLVREEGQTAWRNVSSVGAEPIVRMQSDDQYLYYMTNSKVFKFNFDTQTHIEIFSIIGDSTYSLMRDMALTKDRSRLVVASNNGIYQSLDQGKSWDALVGTGLPLSKMNNLLLLEGEMFAATQQGVFVYQEEQWSNIYQGLSASQDVQIALNGVGNIYAAASEGVFQLYVDYAFKNETLVKHTMPLKAILERFTHEPTITEVHEWAIDYAEVSNEKIKEWRRLARKKALLPTFSMGIDRDASDLFHWNTGANPDELQKGAVTIDWDATLSWDLSDLIWSTDQTSIDSRSKLMVELREDVLDQVTRLYFERRRLQIELAQMEDHGLVHLDKHMRIAELTALIDAMTGGLFSYKVEDLSAL